MLNIDKLGIFESRKQLNKLSRVLPLREPFSDEGPLLGETSNAFLDLGLHTMELTLQFSHVFHLCTSARRLNGEPVSRIRGTREFWGLTFEVTPATLDPRPDTETLVEAALALRKPPEPACILDLGTGTGCILLALLSELPAATGFGVEIVAGAAGTARDNAVAPDDRRGKYASSRQARP